MSRIVRIVAMAGRTVRSTGGKLRLSLGSVRVSAPKGAIRRGETLTVRTAPPGGPGGFSYTGADSLAGGPYVISTSQGEPSRPVTVQLRYERGSLSQVGRPLVLHGWDKLGDWVPERTRSNEHIAIATLDSFSPLDVVDDVTWWAGRVTGNRTELPGNCGEVPSWITGASFPRNRNEALPSCISNRTDAGALRVNIVNNRGYAQLVTVSGARVAAERSGSWTTSVDGIITNELARRSPANGLSSFVLGPGASATIALERPLDLIGQRPVVIRGASRGGSAVAQLAWTLVSAIEKVKKKVAVPHSVINCVTGVLHSSTSSAANAASSIDALRSCLEAGAGVKGIAKAALKKIGAAVLVTDVFHKVIDLAGDEAFPPRMGFVFQGFSETNPDIALGNLDVGTVPAGKTTVWHLTATGGTPPYAFAISTISKNIGRVPGWVSLGSDGTLSISPPAGTDEYVAFSVFVTDATGRRSATGIYEVTFYVKPEVDSTPTGPVLPTESYIAAGSGHTCGLREDGTAECWGEDGDGQASPPGGVFTQIDAGLDYTCGLRVDGAAACWGNNFPYEPASPPGGTFTQLAAGHDHNCGLRGDGSVVCWGDNYTGEASPPSGTFTQLAAGGFHTCGLHGDGTVECWGDDSWDESSPPVGVFIQISAGEMHTCGLRDDGVVECWGDDEAGQASPPGDAFVQVTAGAFHTCGLRTDGSVVCWGFNSFGQSSPPSGSFRQLDAGAAHTCGIRANGSAVCWGWNEDGQATPPSGTFGW